MLQWLTLFLCAIVIVSGAPECHYFTKLPITDTLIGTNVEVKLLLYMNKNSECASLINATHISPLDVKKKTIFLIHGYRPFGSPPNWLNKLIKTLLNVDDINLIIVDWNRGATTINYSTAVTNTKKVAEILKPVIDSILGNGGSLDLIHMIGVSLGAHISGFVGSMFGGKIGRITGLDPAGPLFRAQKEDDRLDPKDALLVEVLHTDIDALGYRGYLGHIDYYANGGTDQPGCPATILSGYHLDKWTNHSSVMRFPNKVFFQTSSEEPYCMYYYLLDIIPWNKNARKGYITIELEDGNGLKVKSKDNHSAKTFEQFREVTLLVSVDRDLKNITGISLKYSSARVVEHKLTLGILRFKLRSLSYPDRPPLCRYDVALQRDEEVKVQPFECRVQEM
ncbi:lipase member H-like isoform X2 [Mobula birostris]|uniref:lipase member H-like isoform X2 n=1 Tax=Mobula birostris TaxID=1983395 RepID=UPI003B28599C